MANIPPRASLNGIPPELRINIFNRVAADLDEVSIIGRNLTGSTTTPLEAANPQDIDKVNFIARKIGLGPGSADAKARLWDTVAKHPLTQTCRQLRQDFDPIYRHGSMVIGVSHYLLEVENFDVGRLGDFAHLIEEVPSVLSHVQSCVNNGRPLVRFHLNNNIVTSVDKVRQDLNTPDRLRTPFKELRAVLLEGLISRMRYDSAQYSWWIARGAVSWNFRTQNMPATAKKAAISQPLERHARKMLTTTCNSISAYSYDGNSDGQYLHVLSHLHSLEHERLARKAKKDKLRPELRTQSKIEIKDEAETRIRNQLKMTTKQPTRAVQKVKSGHREELKRELKKELSKEIGRDVDAEVRAQLKAEQNALREKEKDRFREELRQEFKAELLAEIRAEVRVEDSKWNLS